MSYQSARQIEQVSSLEGQGGSPNGGFAEASIHELMNDLSKKYGISQKDLGTGSGGGFHSEMSGGGEFLKQKSGIGEQNFAEGQLGLNDLSEQGQFGSSNDKRIVQKKLEALSGEGHDVVKQLKESIGEGQAILKKMQGVGVGEKATVLGKKSAEQGLSGSGVIEGTMGQALKSYEKSAGVDLNDTLRVVGSALGPVWLPLMLTAEARRLSERQQAYKSEGSSGMGEAIAQRSKMLKSYKAQDY